LTMNHRSSEPVHSSGELCIQLVDDASPGRCGWAPLIPNPVVGPARGRPGARPPALVWCVRGQTPHPSLHCVAMKRWVRSLTPYVAILLAVATPLAAHAE